jgi:hypothetical protein
VSQIPRGSIGDLGIGNLPGPSTGSWVGHILFCESYKK